MLHSANDLRGLIIRATDGEIGHVDTFFFDDARWSIRVGVVGAMIGGFLFGGPTINESALSLNAMIISLVGAIILLGIVHLVRRGRLV